jgi:HD-like signal output (HDOD) protein
MILPSKLVADFRGTASLPLIYFKLNDAINDPNTSIHKISNVISEDASLSARLLKLVNSPFYGFPQAVGTISEAVFLVGSQQVREVALATTMMSTFNGIPGDLMNMEKFWLHSLACGVGAKVIAETIGEPEFERFFVAGVLHDIGRLVLFSKAPEESKSILRRAQQEKRPMVDVEYDEIGCSHAEIGRALLDAWKLPQYYQEVAGFHHSPESAQQYPLETVIVHVADTIAHTLQYGTSGELYVPQMNKNSWRKLNLSLNQLSKLIHVIEHEVNLVLNMFQTKGTEA